nr:hypothetical protein [uncultured Campylobacter sp.]
MILKSEKNAAKLRNLALLALDGASNLPRLLNLNSFCRQLKFIPIYKA